MLQTFYDFNLDPKLDVLPHVHHTYITIMAIVACRILIRVFAIQARSTMDPKRLLACMEMIGQLLAGPGKRTILEIRALVPTSLPEGSTTLLGVMLLRDIIAVQVYDW
jgi:F0F1-type ATP synthase membrane subunit a